jgi:hypothetical protein
MPAFFTTYSLKHTTIKKLVHLKMELPKINKSARLAMNFTVALTHYSPLAASNNIVCVLIRKDQIDQKEEVNKLFVLEKEKFEEDISKKSMRESQKKLLKNVFKIISASMETNGPPSPSFPK